MRYGVCEDGRKKVKLKGGKMVYFIASGEGEGEGGNDN